KSLVRIQHRPQNETAEHESSHLGSLFRPKGHWFGPCLFFVTWLYGLLRHEPGQRCGSSLELADRRRARVPPDHREVRPAARALQIEERAAAAVIARRPGMPQAVRLEVLDAELREAKPHPRERVVHPE